MTDIVYPDGYKEHNNYEEYDGIHVAITYGSGFIEKKEDQFLKISWNDYLPSPGWRFSQDSLLKKIGKNKYEINIESKKIQPQPGNLSPCVISGAGTKSVLVPIEKAGTYIINHAMPSETSTKEVNIIQGESELELSLKN